MAIIYKSTPKKDRTMDQHCEAVLDLLREGKRLYSLLTDDQKLTWVPGKGRLEHDELSTELKTSFIPMVEMMTYMHKYFPAVEDYDPVKINRLVDECGNVVFGGYYDSKQNWTPHLDTWEIPPKYSYDIFPISVAREALKYQQLPIVRAQTIKRGKVVRPWLAFCDRYGDIIMRA